MRQLPLKKLTHGTRKDLSYRDQVQKPRHVQIAAIAERVKIRIAVPLEFTAFEQASVCMFTHDNIESSALNWRWLDY